MTTSQSSHLSENFCAVGLQSPTIRPTVALTTTWAAKRPAGTPAAFQPAAHPPARYVRVSSIRNLFSGLRKGANLYLEKFIFIH